MGYFISQKSIDKVKPFLDDMVKSDHSLEWKVESDVAKVAYAIRQGIKSSIALYKTGMEEYKEYATLGNKFVVRTFKNTVIAELRGGLSPTIIPQKLILRELIRLEEIVGAIAKHSTREELEFPNAALSLEQLEVFKKWLQDKSMDYRFTDANSLIVHKVR